MRILILNPNATARMTDSAVAVARAALPDAEIIGWTNSEGPPAIQGPEDGAEATKGLLALAPAARAEAFDAIIIACFDDTGLAELRAAVDCVVLGIGQASFHMAALSGKRFEVMTSLAVSVPVIAQNIEDTGFAAVCAGVHATGLAVLEIEAGGAEVEERLRTHINEAAARGAEAVVLGCCAMSPLRARLAMDAPVMVIDGVEAAVHLAAAVRGWARVTGEDTRRM